MSVHTTEPVEVWKEVLNSQGAYEVSNLGRVRSYRNARWGLRKEPKMMRLHSDTYGYKCVRLCIDGKHSRIHRVHVLVLEAFIGPRPEGMCALHGDNGFSDNSIGNLSWGTREKNHGEDRVRDGTSNRGESHGNHKLTEEDVREIRELLTKGLTQTEVAENMEVNSSTISRINTRKRWHWFE